MSDSSELCGSQQANITTLLATWWAEAEQAAHSNRVPRAQRFLRWILAAHPDDEEAWLRLAELSRTHKERVAYLQQAYAFHPTSRRTMSALREARTHQLESTVNHFAPSPATLRCLPGQHSPGQPSRHANTRGRTSRSLRIRSLSSIQALLSLL